MSQETEKPGNGAFPPEGLVNNRKFLQYSFLILSAIAAGLLFLVQHAWESADDARREADALKAKQERNRLSLQTLLDGKPETVRREVVLAFLRVIYAEADGYSEADGVYDVTRGTEVVGRAVLAEKDIDCDVCVDLEIFIGVDLGGKISGFSPVRTVDHAPDAKHPVSESFAKYVGLTVSDRSTVEAVETVAGATKTSSQIRQAVLDTLDRLKKLK